MGQILRKTTCVLSPSLRTDDEDVRKKCQTLKGVKSSGAVEIPPELLKYGTDKLYRQAVIQPVLPINEINGKSKSEKWTFFITIIHKKGRQFHFYILFVSRAVIVSFLFNIMSVICSHNALLSRFRIFWDT